MTMRAIYVCLMALFLTLSPMGVVGAVFAQDQPSSDEHKPPSADDIIAKIQTKLNLTPDQVTAVKPIVEKYLSNRAGLRQGVEDGTIERSDMYAQMKQLKEDIKQELSQVLSADQLSQWEQIETQSWHKHDSGSNGAGALGSGGGNGEGNEEN